MKTSDIATLVALAALWGASYLFMRVGAGEFGPWTLSGARALGAALVLLPVLAAGGGLRALRKSWRQLAVVGIANSALPYLLFAVAAININASLSAIFNAATPMYAAIIGVFWLGEGISRQRALGLAIGFAGVLWLVWDGAGFKDGGSGTAVGWSVAACLAATMLYAFSAHYSKRYLGGVPPLAVAAGSQLVAALALALPAIAWRPAALPSTPAWLALLGLTLACTALAYVLFFRLIERVGAANTMSVPFLVPAFGVLWGVLFLDESLSLDMLGGSGLIVLGTALTTGVIRLRQRAAAA